MGNQVQHFKIKKGRGSYTDSGVRHKAGDIISSTKDLTKIFPNKFTKVDEVPKDKKKDKTLAKPDIDDTVVMDGSVEFEITGIPDKEFIDLIKKTPFTTLDETDVIVFDADGIDEPIDNSIHTIKSELGKNVTKDFLVATGLEIIVLLAGKLYIPADLDMPNRALHDPMTEVELLNWLNNQN